MKDSKKIFLHTYGCQMNKLDSALVCSALKEAEFEIVDSEKEADAILINTCSVREHAEQRVLSHLGNLKHIKETRPQLVVAVIGCMAQRMGGELLKHPAVDIVCGPAQIPQLIDLLKEALFNKSKSLAVTDNILQPLWKISLLKISSPLMIEMSRLFPARLMSALCAAAANFALTVSSLMFAVWKFPGPPL